MLSGFNTNVQHRRVLFHVQTEDSGRARPHVITHLYHGGTILASEKRGYAELLESPDLEGEVRALMEDQHRAMLKQLKRGELDQLIRERLPDLFDPGDDSGTTTSPEPVPATKPALAAPSESEPAREGFGEGVVSEKPLDEVILSYLVENARKRKRSRE